MYLSFLYANTNKVQFREGLINFSDLLNLEQSGV